MADERQYWSTPKFLLITLATAFVVAFVLNGVLNELLDLGVPGGAFGAANGVILALVLVPRWGWFRNRFKPKG